MLAPWKKFMIFSPFERLMAWRYLRARRAEGFISLITAFSLSGIALGVAALIVITSVMNGVKGEMLKHFIGWSGHINVYGMEGAIDNYDTLAARIRAEPGVVGVTPSVEGQVMASANGHALGAEVLALKYEDLARKEHILEKITAGNLDTFKTGDGIIVGARLAENLGVGIGDPLTLISPEGRQTIAGLVPRLKAYPVAATFRLGMNAYDSGMILMPFGEAQVYFKLADGGRNLATGLEITLKNADMAQGMAAHLRQELGEGYRIYDWQESNKSVFEALTIQRNVMFIILTLIILVAAFNIISSLIMLVKDKGRDIAILRTMGATRGTITRIFFACGSLIGVAGTGIGVVLGLLLAVNVDNIRAWIERVSGGKILAEQLYFLSTLPAEIDPVQVMAVVLMSLALSFLATIYPARRAAALDPAEALRYE
jgi:lipoprotein-releasing system permease protein